MENATKALIIAGSILIAILLITFGVTTFNSTRGTTESVKGTMDATEIATFNNKFAGYVGKNINAAKVRSLVNVIISNNSTSSHKVALIIPVNGTATTYSWTAATAGTVAGNMSSAAAALSNSDTYDVVTDYDASGSIITLITVTKHTS